MGNYNDALEALVDSFARLPGIGRKTAVRLAFHLLQQPQEESERFAQALLKARRNISPCQHCFNLTDQEICPICQDPKRDQGKICVVESARDVEALEQTGAYKGLYHVLGGTLNPLQGIAPEHLHMKELIIRLQKEPIEEVILATNTSIEGEATALYIAKLLKDTGILVTRIAQGLPMGGDIKYADDMTLAKAFAGRQTM